MKGELERIEDFKNIERQKIFKKLRQNLMIFKFDLSFEEEKAKHQIKTKFMIIFIICQEQMVSLSVMECSAWLDLQPCPPLSQPYLIKPLEGHEEWPIPQKSISGAPNGCF